jgi:hypothetical protein
MEYIKEHEEKEASSKEGMATGITIFIGTFIRYHYVIGHVGAWIVVSDLCQVH